MAGSIVQSVQFQGTSPLSSGTLPVSLTAGNMLAVFAIDISGAGATITASSSTEGSLTRGSEGNVNDLQANTCAQFSKAITTGGSGSVTVTSATDTVWGWVVEIAGVSAMDSTCHALALPNAPGTGTDAISSGTKAIATSTAFMLSLGVNTTSNIDAPAAGTGFTSTSGTNITVLGWPFSFNVARLEWQAGMSGTKAATWTDGTFGNADTYDVYMMAFTESGADVLMGAMLS
jgi:hypothetical protein